DLLRIRGLLLDQRIMLVEVALDDVQITGARAEQDVEQVADDRNRAERGIESDVACHAPELPPGHTQVVGFPDDVGAERGGQNVPDHGHEPDNGVEADRLVDSRNDEAALEQLLHGLNSLVNCLRVTADGEVHRTRALRLLHRRLLSVSYLGMTASGGKGWNAQALPMKPSTSPRTRENRNGEPNGI